jgi:signal transduction histidine kinase
VPGVTGVRPGSAARAVTRPGWALDLAAGAVVAALLVLSTTHLHAGSHRSSVDAFGYALVIIAGLALAGFRRTPRLVLAVVVIAIGCYVGRRYPYGPILGTGLIALLSLTWQTNRRNAIVGAAALCASLGVGVLVAGGDPVLLPFFLGWSTAIVFLGEALRNRRSYLSELEERARTLEHTREEEARRRVTEERLRIARDLHDGVAHAMATINVQAGAAAHVIDRQPDAAKGALEAIRRASGDVLDELAAMLALLREDDETAERGPTPGIDQIAPLVEATRSTSLRVPLIIDGPTATVPRSVGTAAYRIVQESLTNVLRHAEAKIARVTVRAGDDRSLVIEVCDDGTGAQLVTAGTGVGIRGMRERATSTGGQLEAGMAPGGGFVVRARWAGRT